MIVRHSARSLFSLVALMLGGVASACVPHIPPPNLFIPVQEQEVPVVLAIGPLDMTKVQLDGQPLSQEMEIAPRATLKELLARTQILKDVVLLDLPGTGAQPLNPEQVLAAARAQRADVLLVGAVKEFTADTPTPLFGSRYDISLRAQLQLYNVHTGAQVWKKTESVSVARDGSSIKQRESLDVIVRRIALPALATGLLPPLVEHLQTEYLASLRVPGKGPAEGSELFGGAELAKIDAELAPPATKIAPKEHAYAVIVGIEEYRDLPRVDFARRDAEKIKHYLIKSLGFREQNIVMMLNDNATRSRLRARIEKWLAKQVADHPSSEVFVYYGGHGAPDVNTNQAFLVPYDGDPAFLEETGYSLKDFYKALGALPAKQVTVVMDSCFSGTGGRSVIAKGARPMLITVENPVLASSNMVVLSAAAATQISSALPEKRHGLFTYYILKGLQGEADLNKDGAVEVQELYSYVKPQVEKSARRLNVDQSPQLLPGTELLGTRASLHLVEYPR